jgi:hypothetical protein
MGAPKGNKFALGLTTSGRPPEYSSPTELSKKISEYFKHCTEQEEKVTITGLALYCGFCTRKSLDDYEDKGEEYLYIIKRAKLAVENSYETHGQTIDIFALKNMGWKDEQHFDHTTNGKAFNNLTDNELISRINKLLNSGTTS